MRVKGINLDLKIGSYRASARWAAFFDRDGSRLYQFKHSPVAGPQILHSIPNEVLAPGQAHNFDHFHLFSIVPAARPIAGC
jgi:hypothetical protein